MNANELADKLEKDGEGCTCAAYCAGECACDANWAEYHTKQAATMLRQQQAEIEALKKACLDEIFKRTYADRSTKVMEQYWQEAQANASRYEWLRAEFAAGRETYLAVGIPSGEELDKYIDGKANK